MKTTRTAYEANAVIIATGSHYREIGVKGEKEFRGRGVSYCGVCDGPLFKGKRVLVVGGGNSAATTTLYLSGIAAEVTVAHRRDAFRAEEALVKDIASKKNVQVFLNTEVKEIKGEKFVTNVVLFDKKAGETKELLLTLFSSKLEKHLTAKSPEVLALKLTMKATSKVDIFQRTNIAGVYAAGDVTNHPVKQVGTAVGQGITAASKHTVTFEDHITENRGKTLYHPKTLFMLPYAKAIMLKALKSTSGIKGRGSQNERKVSRCGRN